MKSAKTALAALLFVTLTPTAFATTYYVAQSWGNDSNNGSASAPWRTIGQATSIAGPGDTVNIAAGTYSEDVTLSKSGNPDNPIIFQGQDQPVIRGQLNFNGSYTTVSGVTVSPPGEAWGAVYVRGSYNTFLKSTVTNYHAAAQQQVAAITTSGSFNTIDQYQILDLADIDGFHVWGHDITISNGLVQGLNQVDYIHNHTDWVQTWSFGWSAESYNILIINNEVRDSSCQLGNTETDGNPNLRGWTFVNNVFNNITNAFFSGLPNTYWYNNIFDHVGDAEGYAVSLYGPDPTYDSTGFQFINNIFRNNLQDINFNRNAANSPGLITNNYFAADNNLPVNNGEALGHAFINGGDPEFVSAPTDYRLQPGSILIGKGTPIPGFPLDKEGRSRWGGLWNLGPYAYSL